MAKKTIAIVQARMGSKRLPQKMMKDICGKPLIQHVFERLSYSKCIDKIILATTNKKQDDSLSEFIIRLGFDVYRGSENNVLSRYHEAANKFKANIIVRVTGDCPLIDPKVVDSVINYFKDKEYDYVSNITPPSYPDGLDTEVFSFFSLQKAQDLAILSSEREHVTPFIIKNPQIFKIGNFLNPFMNLSDHRWTVDTVEDLELVKKIYKNLYLNHHLFDMEEIYNFLLKNPDLKKINRDNHRNEGYLLSLKNDKKINKYEG